MRVSTQQYFQTTIGNINEQQSRLLEIQQQMSSGKRLVSPADDPVAAGRSLALDTARRATEQWLRNQDDLKGQLELVDSFVANATDVVQNFRARMVQAGNSSLSASDRQSIAADFVAMREQLLGLANARAENGNYIFSGSRTNVEPFARASGSNQVEYSGDTLVRELQVAPNRQIAASFSGAYVFNDIPEGDGVIVAYERPATPGSIVSNNTGTALLTNTTVVDRPVWDAYVNAVPGPDLPLRVEFSKSVPSLERVDQYTVFDDGGATVIATQPLPSPLTETFEISLGVPLGVSMRFQGVPAENDAFEFRPAKTENVFTVMDRIIEALSIGGTEGATRRANVFATYNQGLDQALDRMLEARALAGSRLLELDQLGEKDREISDLYKGEVSRLVDLDYVDAAGRLASRQLSLQAAQQSYARVSQLSLFQYL
jgi:flagellar hook-associated protein 3 FlgL